jgi:FkbM family methyltransferase
MNQSPFLDDLMDGLASLHAQHGPAGPVYRLLRRAARREVGKLFRAEEPAPTYLGPIGPVRFPYVRMGAVDTLNLFDIDELILFSFYWHARGRYRRVADLGANLGLHSIVLSRCGFEVRAYEPDPTHYALLQRNLTLNGCANVRAVQAAVSRRDGSMEFVRVLGNTTGSHLAGAKPSPYGDLERFPVRVEALSPLLEWADLIKMDVEGHEAEILLGTTPEQWRRTDAVVEIGSPENARAVFEHFHGSGVRFYAQKDGWRQVDDLSSMPTGYKDGSVFLTCKDAAPWQETVADLAAGAGRMAS